MFMFEAHKLHCSYHILRSISQSTIDPRVVFVGEGGVDVKLPVPVSIARRMKQKLNNVTRFSVEFPCCIAFLDGKIVAMDVPQQRAYIDWKDTKAWVSPIEKNMNVLKRLQGDWMFDGQYAYQHSEPLQHAVGTSFGHQPMSTYNLYKMDLEVTLEAVSLAGLAYSHPNQNKWTVTCPVTRSSTSFLQLTGDVERWSYGDQHADVEDIAEQLDKIDRTMFVNLKFVNYTARRVSDLFGFEAAEPLGLPLIMSQHRTMNLTTLSQSVQQSSPAPFSFTTGLAWVIGLFDRVTTLEQLAEVKAIMKMLLTKGNTERTTPLSKEDDTEISMRERVERLRQRMTAAPLLDFSNRSVAKIEEDE